MGIDTIENNPIRQQTVAKFWPVAAVVLIVYILIAFFILNDYLNGWIQSVNLLILIVGAPLCLKTKKILLACNLLALLGLITIIPMIFTGGPGGSGFWLSITYVVGAFLITTKKWAIFWLSLYFFITATIVILSLNGLVKIAYEIPELLNLLFIFVITFIFIYLFNQVRERYLHIAEKQAAKLVETNSALATANKELEQFAYVASHDLQEPIRTISSFAGLIEKNYSENKDQDFHEYLAYIISSSARMKQLVQDLLDFSRIQKNTPFTLVDLNSILKDIISDLNGGIHESDAAITVSSLPVLRGNEVELKRLFQNLISNAIKFRKENVKPQITISFEEKVSEYVFQIKDNGIGIEEKFYERIFIIFQRLHNVSEYSGTGIGLAICKKIVALHSGKIWVKSKAGEGSTFWFTLSKEI